MVVGHCSETLLDFCIVVTGSRSYNFATENSDIDYRGFGFQKDESRIIGLLEPLDVNKKCPDITIWDATKFMKLLLKCNTNTLDIVFADQKCIVHNSLYLDEIRKIREQFLSENILRNSILGYAKSEYMKALGLKGIGDLGDKRRGDINKFSYARKNAHHCIRIMLAGLSALRSMTYKVRWEKDDNWWSDLMALKTGELPLSDFKKLYIIIEKTFINTQAHRSMQKEKPVALANEILVKWQKSRLLQ
ncbi:MAG: nucleotidyltransferase domain-containing protein [Balneolaceae bacterium]